LSGIIKGDEIMVINGALVGDLDMMYIESVLQEELSLSLMIRSCRADPPDVTCLLRTTDDLIDSLVCPPPPSDQLITDDALSNLIVPAPSWRKIYRKSHSIFGCTTFIISFNLVC
jgi:T-lymphoma invasion and metastasis-inducing protein 1